MDKTGVLFVFGVLGIVLFCSMTSAAINTTLVVHSTPFHNQIVRVVDPASMGVMFSVYPKAHYTGISNVTFSTTRNQITFRVIDRYNKQDVKFYDTNSFSVYPSNGIIDIWLDGAMEFNEDENIIEGVDTNETEGDNETEETTEEDVNASAEESDVGGEESELLTGLSIANLKEKINFRYMYYTIGIILVLAAVFLLVLIGRKKFAMLSTAKKAFAPSSAGGKRAGSLAERISDAESRIKKAQEKIDEVKNREIKKAERKLKTLKGESSSNPEKKDSNSVF